MEGEKEKYSKIDKIVIILSTLIFGILLILSIMELLNIAPWD